MIQNLTIVIPAYNEENNLKRLKLKFQNKFYICVYDNFSEDKTKDLAIKYGWQFVQFKNKGYAEDPNLVRLYLKNTKTEWIYICRADEVPSDGLIRILENLDKLKFDAIRVARKSILHGKICHAWGNDYEIPIFKKRYFEVKGNDVRFGYPGIFLPSTKIKQFPMNKGIFIYHYQNFTVSSLILTCERYSSLILEGYIKEPRIPSSLEENFLMFKLRKFRKLIYTNKILTIFGLFFMPPFRFFWHLIYKRGFRSGFDGILVSFLMSLEEAFISAKALSRNIGWPR